MDAETLEALRGSIAKWEGIVAGTTTNEGPDNCPLCLRFNSFVNKEAKHGCRGCPVREKVGMSGCDGTPYEEYEDFERRVDDADEDADEKHAIALAQAELDFLKSLLPKDSSSDEKAPPA